MPYRRFLFSALAERFPLDFYFFNERKENIPTPCSATILKGFKVPKFSDYWVVPGLRGAISSKKYDLIIGSDLGAFVTKTAYEVAKKTATPFIPWIEEWDWIDHPRRKLRVRFEEALLKYSVTTIVPGNKHKKYLLSRGVPATKIDIVRNCIPEEKKEYNTGNQLFKKLSEIKKTELLVCSIGRHVSFKGHHQLIEAQAVLEGKDFAKAPFLVIAGDGNLLEKNKTLATQLSLKKIMFIERFIGLEEKNILFSLCDIFVLASTRTRAFEAWGLVCNEAIRFGKPIIVSNMVGSAGDLIQQDKNGFIFEDKNIDQLAGYIEKLIQNAPLRQQFSQHSSAIYKEFRPQVMITEFSAVIEKILAHA
jgi:glycosyltransferase involved in cell wall biosynthesis